MVKESIAAGTITTMQLQPHQRKRNRGGNPAQSTITTINQNYILHTAGEEIFVGNAISIGNDGKAYKASNLASDNKPCSAFAIESASTDEKFKCYNSFEVYVDIELDSGKAVFLSYDGAVTTDIPEYVPGNYLQIVGTAKGTNLVVVSLAKAAIFE